MNRLELSTADSAAAHRYERVPLDAASVDRLWVEVFLESHLEAPKDIVIDLDATDSPVQGRREVEFSTATTTTMAVCRSRPFAATTCLARDCVAGTSARARARSPNSHRSSSAFELDGRARGS